MKKVVLFFSGIAIAMTVNSQKVALHTSTGVQHFTGSGGFVSAYNAASSGDTIYLPGGGYTSPGTIDKSLLIFGAGHYPDSTQATSKTIINSTIQLSQNADGIRLEGLEINGNINTDNNESVNNITIKYCKATNMDFAGSLTTPCINPTIINCVFTGTTIFYLSNAQNAGIYNSIICGQFRNSYGNTFENNIFMLNISNFVIGGDNNNCNNNIFLNPQAGTFNGISNQINNNLFVNVSPILGTTPITANNYTGVAQSEIFTSQSGYAFDYSHNYHLQSPATYLGIDGKEVGIYGGFNEYKEGAVPSNPHIQWKNIAPITTTDGLLNVQINAAAQDK